MRNKRIASQALLSYSLTLLMLAAWSGCTSQAARHSIPEGPHGISVTSNPPGIEIYQPLGSAHISYHLAGRTPVTLNNCTGKFKLAAYKDKRIKWLEIDSSQTDSVQFEFTDANTGVVTREDSKKIYNTELRQAFQDEEDDAQGRTLVDKTAKEIDEFKKQITDAGDSKQRIRLIKASLDRMCEGCGTVLDNYASAWSRAIDKREDFTVEVLRVQIRLTRLGVIPSLIRLDGATKEAFDSLKELPEGQKAAFSVLVDYYGTAGEAISLVKSPTGSLTSFRQRVDAVESGAKQKSSKLEVLAR
jgi:hypothetical protein